MFYEVVWEHGSATSRLADATIGGNDVELVKLLNQCIYQVAALTPAQAEFAKLAVKLDEKYELIKDFDFDSLGRGCDEQIERTRNIARGYDFANSLDRVVGAARKKLATG